MNAKKKIIILIALATAIIACNDEGVIVIDDYVVEDTTQENSLVGTKWNFINGFNVEGNKLLDTNWKNSKSPGWDTIVWENWWYEGWWEEKFTLYFDTDSTISGTTNIRELCGKYIVNFSLNNIGIIYFKECYGSFIGDSSEGFIYEDSLSKVQSYSFTEEELKLYYNEKNNYLLFRRNNEK